MVPPRFSYKLQLLRRRCSSGESGGFGGFGDSGDSGGRGDGDAIADDKAKAAGVYARGPPLQEYHAQE
eukprot:1826905-Pleurochrysis_carterae.AAC.1